MRDRRIGLEGGPDRLRSLDEQCDCVLIGKREAPGTALAGEMERLATRHEDLHLRRLGQQRGDGGGGLDEVLEVVEQQERPPRAQMGYRLARSSDGGCDRRLHQAGIGE